MSVFGSAWLVVVAVVLTACSAGSSGAPEPSSAAAQRAAASAAASDQASASAQQMSASASAPASAPVSAPASAMASASPRYGSRFTLCSRGTYASYAVFRDGSRSQTAAPGTCTTKQFALKDGPHRANLYGIDADLDRAFLIGTDWFGSDYDADLQTTGTPAAPDWSEF